jgi:hypothetical protein
LIGFNCGLKINVDASEPGLETAFIQKTPEILRNVGCEGWFNFTLE